MGCVARRGGDRRRCGYCLLEVLADVLGRRQVVLADAAVQLISQQGDGLAVIGDLRAQLRDRGVPSVHRAAVRASRSALQRAEGGG